MPCQARLNVSVALYHIMVRGINKSAIFDKDQDKARFLERLGWCTDPEQRSRTVGLDELGLSLVEIARHVGVTTTSVAQAVAHLEEEGRPPR